MRRSEKILLATLVLGLIVWQGARFADRLLFEPIRGRRAELNRLDEQVAEQEKKQNELLQAEAQLREWHQRSLPPDPFTAQRLYQQWLTDLAQDCGFAALKVYPDRVKRKNDACVSVLVSINAEAKLDQLGRFLSRFYRTELAQQITVLNIESTQDRGDPVLKITIIAEGLSLGDAPSRQTLFPDQVPDVHATPNGSAADYMHLVTTNPFAKPMPQVAEERALTNEPTPEIDPAEYIYLVAAFAQDDQRQAWLYDRLNNENVVIKPGQPFTITGIGGVVRVIGDDYVLLDHDDSRWRLRLGKNLRSMQRVPATDDNNTVDSAGDE